VIKLGRIFIVFSLVLGITLGSVCLAAIIPVLYGGTLALLTGLYGIAASASGGPLTVGGTLADRTPPLAMQLTASFWVCADFFSGTACGVVKA
jgi:hypothetical protein